MRTPRKYVFDVTSIGQRKYVFDVTSVGQRKYVFDVTSIGQLFSYHVLRYHVQISLSLSSFFSCRLLHSLVGLEFILAYAEQPTINSDVNSLILDPCTKEWETWGRFGQTSPVHSVDCRKFFFFSTPVTCTLCARRHERFQTWKLQFRNGNPRKCPSVISSIPNSNSIPKNNRVGPRFTNKKPKRFLWKHQQARQDKDHEWADRRWFASLSHSHRSRWALRDAPSSYTLPTLLERIV